jgi:4-hydroxy-tetrahydrodipicolinate synthase
MAFNADAKGVYSVAVTPFLENGQIDFESVDSLTDFYLGKKVSGITVLGQMGEAPKLDTSESIALVKRIAARAGKVPIVVGVSAPGFASMRGLALQAMDNGAAGVMIAPTSALRTDRDIANYYGQAIEAIGADIPFAIQDYPLTTQVVFAPDVLRQIVEAHPSCVMIKHEDWPGLEKITTIRKLESEGRMRKISILCGNGGLFLDLELGRGANGAMTGYAFPEMLVRLTELAANGALSDAHDLFDAHLPMIRMEQQLGLGLAVRKYVLKLRGAIRHDGLRKPGPQLSESARREVKFLLARLAERDKVCGIQ